MTPPQTVTTLHPGAVARPRTGPSIESLLERRWAKWLIPSLSDLFFLALLVWLFMSSGAAGWQGLIADADVGWHIRTGEYILDHHSVPHHDLYSFSKPNAPWYAWEWLSDVTDGALFRLAGLKGIVLMAGVVIALFATSLIRRMIWRDIHLFAALVIALLSVGAASIHFLARPHIFTLFLLSISMWMIEADRRAPSRRIWLLAPLALVWTNLHGGFLVLVAVLGLATAGIALETWLGRGAAGWNPAPAIRYAALTAACGLVSLVNPYGWGLHKHVLEYLRSDWIRNVIQEFQSPSFRNENMLQFEALLFLGLMTAGALWKRKQVVEGLWIVFFAYLSLSSVRHVPVFVTVTAPIIAAEVASWWRAATDRASKKSLTGILNQMAADSTNAFRRTSAWPAAAVVALVLMGKPIQWPKDFPSEIFPVEIIHAHQAEILNARLFTTDQWADYLIFLHPEQKVFVDGRSDFYGSEIGNEYLHAMNGQWDWKKIMAKYRFNMALLPIEGSLAQLLKQSPEWRVVTDDGKRILLVLRSSPVLDTRNPGPEPRF